MSIETTLEALGPEQEDLDNITYEQTEFGLLVYVKTRRMSIEQFQAVGDKAPKDAVMVPGVAKAYNAFMAICAPDKAEPWVEAAAQHAKNISNGDREVEWVKGPYTGASSETIFSALAGDRTFFHLADPARMVRFCPATPSDPDDFSRCYRLLQWFPEWYERISDVGKTYQFWKPFSDNWQELTELYEAETAVGVNCPRLYARLQELTEQSRAIMKERATKSNIQFGEP